MYKNIVKSTSSCLHLTLAQDLNKKEFMKYYLSWLWKVLKINVYANYLIIKQWAIVNNDVTKGGNIWKQGFPNQLQISHAHLKKNVYFSYLLSGRNVKNEATGESYKEVSWSFILLKFSIGFKL